MTGIASETSSQEAAPFSFTMEVEEDIEQEIETFVRFKRRGEYEKAEEMFQQTLSGHLSLFPVIAEYADLLLVQGEYRILSEFLDIQMQYMEPVLEEEESELLRIMKALVHIHTQGSLRSALTQASRTWYFLHRRSTKLPFGTLPGDVEIHVFEIYINIIIFALTTSNWVGSDEMKCPWALDINSDHCGFIQWYLALSCNGHLWSASQVLLVLLQALPLFPAQDAAVLFDNNCFGSMASERFLWNLSEMDQLIAYFTSFGRAEALMNLALILYEVDTDDVKWKALYELALGYSHIADFLPAIILHRNIVSLIDLRAYVQRTQFERVREALTKPKLFPTALSPGQALDRFPEALFRQDPRCSTLYYFQSLLAHAQGLSNHHPISIDLPSLSDLQLHTKGTLTGCIRTCELFCTLMNNFENDGESRPEKAILSSEADSFLADFRSPEKTTQLQQSMAVLAKQLQDQIQQIIPEESPELHFEQSVELILSCEKTSGRLDIPLYLWAMHSNLGILDLRLRDTPTLMSKPRFSDSFVQVIRSFLPKPASREALGEIAHLVQEASEKRVGADQEANEWQEMESLSQGGPRKQSLATWAKLCRDNPKTNLNLNMDLNQKMSSSPYARQYPAVVRGHHSPLGLNTTDPSLSAQSDPEESDFHAGAIRPTPVNASPNHTSSPYDDAGRPSITSQGLLPPGGNEYPDPSSSTAAANQTEGFLDPTNGIVNSFNISNEGSSLVSGEGQSATAASNAQWLSSTSVDTTQFLDPERTMPSPFSVLGTKTVQSSPGTALPTQALFVAPQESGTSSNPTYDPSILAVSTNHVSNNELTSLSLRGRSPIRTMSKTSRGDSSDENAPESRPSQSPLSTIGPEKMVNVYDDNDDHHSISSVSAIPSYNGTNLRNPTAARRGQDPFSRGDKYRPSLNELQGRREQEQKNVEIGRWTENVSAANSDVGDDHPAQSRRRIQRPYRIRALSTGARPLQQADYFNLKASDRLVLGPGLMLHESSDDGIVSEDDSDGSTAPDSLPSLADDRVLYDYSIPGVYTSQKVAFQDESFPLYPWQDSPRDPMPRVEVRQPGSSAAATATFERRAKEQDAASITATIDNNSIISFTAGFERSLRISDAPKKHASWSSSFFKRGVQQAQQRMKRQASDLSLASAHSNIQPGGPEPPQPQRKESAGSTYRHRLSLSSKHSPRPHSRSPSLTNALMSMTGQMAAVGGSHSVQAVSPHADASPKNLPVKWGSDRAKSEVPRPTTPGLFDLTTTHGGPPVASLSRYCKIEPDAEEPRASMAPSLDVPGAEDDEDGDAHDDDKGLVMEFPAVSRLPVPTMEGFKSQIMQLNPRLDPALINRFAGEQVRRYRKLIEYQQKHAAAVAKGSCKSGSFCFALGGQAVLLPQRKTAADAESGRAHFRVTDGHDKSYISSEGAVVAAQFPPGVPLPPVARLPAKFECPVCFQVKTIQKPSDWSKHIFEDVQPFTCTFPGCTEPKSFKRKADWVRHESELHRHLEWWCCSYPDCTHTCYRKHKFSQHLVREHKLPDPKDAPGDGSVDRLIEECKNITQDTPVREPCRFCGNNCNTWKKLSVHLRKHMEQLAMPVLELARQSCASQHQGHGQSWPIGTADSFATNHNTGSGRAQTQAQAQAPSQAPTYYGDIPSFNFTSMTGVEISMEPESMTEPLQPGDQFSGFLLDPTLTDRPMQAVAETKAAGAKEETLQKRTINDYVILEEMGQGAYAEVKLACLKKQPNKKMVLKYVTKKRILKDTWTRGRRLGTVPLEIHVLDFLRRDGYKHPHIVEMEGFFEDDINYYIEMIPHGLPGMDLFDYIELKANMDESECRNIFKQVTSAIHHLHTKALVVHRDIKDENVVLDGEGRIKLIDFGSAAYIKNGPFDVFVGTIDCAAPEVLQGKSYRGLEQDIWALGILLYVIVYKENPFYNVDEILDHPLRIPFLPYSEACVDLLRKMLNRDVDNRLTITEVLEHPWMTEGEEAT